jgi:hypothetical protein
MKKLSINTLSLFVIICICFSIDTLGQLQNKQKLNKNSGCYAEISIREGGHWKDRIYEGGTFRNVQKMKLPAQHTDHSNYIRYEGPGWESDKIGYRLYLDWRNAIDLFGKVKDSIVLAGVGQDGFDSYHNMSAWGQDILKVGNALGIGSIGRWVDKEVVHFNQVDSTLLSVHNSKKESDINIQYYGWKSANDKVDLKSHLSISPGNRFTKHTIKVSKSLSGICTGIVNLNAKLIKQEIIGKKWAYIATYGAQSLIPDNLGMVVFYKTADVEKVFDWEFDHLIMFKPSQKPITFYFLAAWEKEENGIKTEAEFISYLNGLLSQLNAKNKI